MDEYIDKNKAINAVFEAFADGRSAYIALEAIPAADVVSVVRCKDCKWCHAGYCEKYDDLIPFGCANKPWKDWFCAGGAKMEGGKT